MRGVPHLADGPNVPSLEDWAPRGNCYGLDPELFTGHAWERDDQKKIREYRAKRVCEGCPVKALCLEEAITNDEYGVWGGTTRSERIKIRRRRAGNR